MKTRFFVTIVLVAIFPLRLVAGSPSYTGGDDFNAVVKMVEKFYGVKHQGIPFLAKAGIKMATTAARIKGGQAKRIAEAGSIKLAVFENQEFNGDFTRFRASLNEALNVSWMPLVQTLSSQDQTYIFLRDAGAKFNVLVITIAERDATVVQVNISQNNLAQLLRDPEGTGKTITEEATIVDQE